MFSTPLRRFVALLILAIAFIVTLILSNDGNSAITANPIGHTCPGIQYGDNPLNFEAKAGPVTAKAYILVLRASSCTDMPLPGVTVTISHCPTGQQLPFRILSEHVRPLGANEALGTLDRGKTLRWHTYSVPPVNARPLELRVPLRLQTGRTGPVYCVRVVGHTTEYPGQDAAKTVMWKMK